jgi:mRNA interferase RelE/StbE
VNEPRRYIIRIARAPAKLLPRLPRDLQGRIGAAIDALALNPRPPGCKRLRGQRDYYRIRVGDWRILYTIEDDVLLVEVVEIGPRSSMYEGM